MNALLLVAHGSRRSQSNDEVTVLAGTLKKGCAGQYTIVHTAFLELATPLIPEGVRQCAEDGAKSIVILPYFLNSGRHVTEDIPKIISESQSLYPHIDITIASHLGKSDQMINLLLESASKAVKS
jgi:sirohydrochlorin ferrochelatase